MPRLSLAKLERHLYSAADRLRQEGLDAATHKLYVAGAKPNTAGGRGNDPESFHVFVFGMK